jgi:hypothetical protein
MHPNMQDRIAYSEDLCGPLTAANTLGSDLWNLKEANGRVMTGHQRVYPLDTLMDNDCFYTTQLIPNHQPITVQVRPSEKQPVSISPVTSATGGNWAHNTAADLGYVVTPTKLLWKQHKVTNAQVQAAIDRVIGKRYDFPGTAIKAKLLNHAATVENIDLSLDPGPGHVTASFAHVQGRLGYIAGAADVRYAGSVSSQPKEGIHILNATMGKQNYSAQVSQTVTTASEE